MAEKILVVDDDLDTLRLVGMMLERQGYQIIAASNGEQALELTRTEKPELIILDLMMPEIDGLEIAQRLRSDPETQDILIIMFTAKAQLDDKLVGYDYGADDYLTKPVQPAELVAHVRAVLRRTSKAPAPQPTTLSHKGHVVGVISAKGGVGVSTVVTNLGVTLAKRNRDVLVADFRPGCSTIRLELGIQQPNGLTKLLSKAPEQISAEDIETEIIHHPLRVRFLLSSPYPRDGAYANAVDHFETLAKRLAYMAPVVLLDLGASLTPTNEKVLSLCDSIVVVLEPIPQTVIQTRSLIEELLAKNIAHDDHLDIALVNRMRTGIQMPFGQVQDMLGYSLGVIFTPVPELAYQAQDSRTPMVAIQPDSLTAEQFDSLAELVARKDQHLA
jgi:pilus assembly protein CpaE